MFFIYFFSFVSIINRNRPGKKMLIKYKKVKNWDRSLYFLLAKSINNDFVNLKILTTYYIKS